MYHFKRVGVGALALATSITLLTGCGASSGGSSSTSSAAATTDAASASSTTAAPSGLTLADGWVKATSGEMTGAFGMLTNATDADIHLVGGSSPAAGMVELHETVMVGGEMKMRPAEGGFVIPAGGTFELKPGANHIMLMMLKQELKAGESADVVVTAEDGTTYDLGQLPIREFTGGNETYVPSDKSSDTMSSMTATPSS